MRRAVNSIVANIAEGSGKNHLEEYIQYISIAICSSNELESFILLSKELQYINDATFNTLIDDHAEVSKMLYALRKSLQLKIPK